MAHSVALRNSDKHDPYKSTEPSTKQAGLHASGKTLLLQIAQSRSYLDAVGLKVSIICRRGAPGNVGQCFKSRLQLGTLESRLLGHSSVIAQPASGQPCSLGGEIVVSGQHATSRAIDGKHCMAAKAS